MQVFASPRAQEALRAARAAERAGAGGDAREKDREAEALLAQILKKPVGVPKAQFYRAPLHPCLPLVHALSLLVVKICYQEYMVYL